MDNKIEICDGVVEPVVFYDNKGIELVRVEKIDNYYVITFNQDTPISEHKFGWWNGIRVKIK